jgi:pimeloyl-ACP methyl ester carboxylesterase
MRRISSGSRLLSALALGCAVAVTLSGCFLLPTAQRQSAGSPTATPSATKDYAAQTVDWTSCGTSLECAMVTIPVDWDDFDAGNATIAVAKHVASGTAQGTLFVNPGGPGGSGYDFVRDSASYAVSSAVLADYDIVGWDPRGVGRSTAVQCLNGADTDELLYGTYESPYFTQGWIDDLTEQEATFAAACAANTGAFLGHVDTVSTAKDLELLRQLVGSPKLDYLGYSYGTFIGAMYAELFPTTVGRMVLDGAVDPKLDAFDELVVQMAGFESAFRAYMADCLGHSACPFTGSVPVALGQARTVLDTVDGKHLVSSDGRTLDSATLGTGIAESMYSESYWPYLTTAFSALRTGDPDPAFLLADAYNRRTGPGRYDGNSFEVYTAVVCLDNDFAADTSSTLDRLDEIDAAAPTIGRFIAIDDFAALDTVCSEWPYPPAVEPETYDAVGAPPIIVIGTSNDPATPLAWSQSLARQLSSGVLVTVTGEGHTSYNKGNRCVDRIVDGYLLDGSVPAAASTC